MDCQSQTADFASAFLARDQSTATDFEVVETPWRSAPTVPIGRFSKLIRVRKLSQYWIVLRRTEVFDQAAKDWIHQRITMHDVQVEWD
jgi:hypothetical protein